MIPLIFEQMLVMLVGMCDTVMVSSVGEAAVSGVSLGQVADIPLTNVQYVAGKGTNALTFTATLSKDFEVTPDVNNDIKNLKPVTGTVKDVLGN